MIPQQIGLDHDRSNMFQQIEIHGKIVTRNWDGWYGRLTSRSVTGTCDSDLIYSVHHPASSSIIHRASSCISLPKQKLQDLQLWVNTGLIPFLVKFTLLILVLWSVIAPGEMSDHQEALSTD